MNLIPALLITSFVSLSILTTLSFAVISAFAKVFFTTFPVSLTSIVISSIFSCPFVEVNCFNESTKRYCGDFLSLREAEYSITLTKQDLIDEASTNEDGKVYVNEEISALYRKIADILIERNIVVFHGSSFSVENNGFIITARSGVGKSTHAKLLEEYLKDKFMYINDDKPLLEVKDNEVIIYSSPWNGKERRGNNISSPLRTIIFLNRGIDNTYKKIEDRSEVYFKLLSQIYLPKEKSKREKALKIADILLKNINMFEIYVNKDISAAKMTYERIIKNEIK